MNIVVCVKQVPDTEVERGLVPGDNTVDRASVDGVINYLDEFAIEEGLKIAEAQGGRVDPQGPVDGRGQGRPRD